MNSGFYIINKPSGITSSDLVLKIKRIKKLKKIGHTGTLDKFASGLMILPFGKFTNFASHFLESRKSYRAEILFGKSTDSGDPDGETIQEWDSNQIEKWVQENSPLLASKVQEILKWKSQIPPKVSALKINGKRMSDLYRVHTQFEPIARPIQIYESNLIHLSNKGFEFSCTVSSGTYIRKIVMDISEQLNFPMYLKNLVRTAIGKIQLEMSSQLEEFEQNQEKVYSPGEILDLPWVEIDDKWKSRFLKGVTTPLPKLYPSFLVQDNQGELLAWCKSDDGLDYKYQKVFIQS